MSATATLGLILLWDVDGGLTQIDKYLYSSEDYIKVSTDFTDAIRDVVVTRDGSVPIMCILGGHKSSGNTLPCFTRRCGFDSQYLPCEIFR